MSEQRPQDEANRVGDSDHPQRRTPGGEGAQSTMSEEESGPAQISHFDGAGNEQVSALTEDEEGRPRQGTGKDAEEAIKDARSGTPLGEGFNPPP